MSRHSAVLVWDSRERHPPQRDRQSGRQQRRGPGNGVTLFDETAALIRHHVVMTPAQADASTLWLAAAYLIDVLAVMALLLITAPTMRAGKSTR